jgi:hypothetical protein
MYMFCIKPKTFESLEVIFLSKGLYGLLWLIKAHIFLI